MRLAIITTHPIQYYAPVFKLLHERKKIDIKVFYTRGQNAGTHDHGFGKAIDWDIPLLDGYPYEWVQNTAAEPGSHHYKGIVNPGLIKQVQEWQPNAVLFFGWAYQSHFKAMRYFKGRIPVYFRGDSTLLNEPAGIRKILKTVFLRWVYNHVYNAFYVGTNNKAYFKKYGLKDEQLTFTPHAIDNSRFESDHAGEANELRLSLHIKPNDILVLYAGKFEYVKNVELLLSAFIKLNRENVHLLLVGNGVKEPLLKGMAADSDLAGNIHFLDFKNQSAMPALYQCADLFCLPSFSETWGLAINEAMACGKAILASDKVGCAIDLVKKDVNGDIFESGNEDSLVNSLDELTRTKTRLTEMGKNSALIIKDWNFVNIAIAIENKLTDTTA
ncbi:MAG: glycosyltransferase family 4 protein [Sphingobacteriales bacterium]